MQVALGGRMFQEHGGLGPAELIGILAAIVILLVAFGSLLAMGLPILIALFGIGIGLGLVELLSHVIATPDFATQLASMIGIGVGIDYALFIVTRYRQGLDEGLEPEHAVVRAIDTAGRAVVFAGCTVVISLLGLFLMGVDFVNGMAVGTSVTVGDRDAGVDHAAAGDPRASPGAPSTASRCAAAGRRSRASRACGSGGAASCSGARGPRSSAAW